MKLINRSEPEKAETEKAAPVVQKAVVQKQHTTVKHYTTAKTPAATEVAAAPAKTKLPRSELNAVYHVKLQNHAPLNEVELREMYQDNVPPEALVLDEFLKN